MKSLIESLNDSLLNEGFLDKIKSIFKKSKKDVKLKEYTAQEMLDKLGVFELDNISDGNLIKISEIYKKTIGNKWSFESTIECLAWVQGLYDGAYTNVDDTKYDQFGEDRLDNHKTRIAKEINKNDYNEEAKSLLNTTLNYPELSPSPTMDFIYGYIYGFEFARLNHLECKEKKEFTYKDGLKYNKILK